MIQIIYDKIVDFCGVEEIPCVIVGSKMDLQDKYVTFSTLLLDYLSLSFRQKSSGTILGGSSVRTAVQSDFC